MSSIDEINDDMFEDNNSGSIDLRNIIRFKGALTKEDIRVLVSELGNDIYFEGSSVYIPTERQGNNNLSSRIYEKISHIEIFDVENPDLIPLCIFPSSSRDYNMRRSFKGLTQNPYRELIPDEIPYLYNNNSDWHYSIGLRLCRALYLNAKIIGIDIINRKLSRSLPKPEGKIVSIDEFNFVQEIDTAKWKEIYSYGEFMFYLYHISTIDGATPSIYIAVRRMLKDNCAAVAYEV